MKPLNVDLPYPNTDALTPDKKTAILLFPSYGGRHGELTAVLQYVYHALFFEKAGDLATRDTLLSIAVSEMEHIEILGKTLVKLGADPIYTENPFGCYPFYDASHVSYSKTPERMLLDDLAGEMLAINEYKSVLERTENEDVKTVVTRILLDEELHAQTLKNLIRAQKGEKTPE